MQESRIRGLFPGEGSNAMRQPVYVVVGALQPVGACIASQLHGGGAQVVLADRGGRDLESTARLVGVAQHAADPRSSTDLRRCLDRVVVEHGQVDGVIGCAGAVLAEPKLPWSETGLDQLVAHNVRSTHAIVSATGRGAWPGLRAVVFVQPCSTSKSGLRPNALHAARAALSALVREASDDRAPHAPTYNAVDPGLGIARVGSGAVPPLERIVFATGKTVEWLLAPGQSWISGQTFGVDTARPSDPLPFP